MGGIGDALFGKPAAPAAVKETPTAMPIKDDERQRREALKQSREASESGGRSSTMMTGSRTGDMSKAETRSGFGRTMITG
ncbi:MAG: hypothetical protein KDI55_00320 [Anaerolineae bacterium]|nr:hypothetical protein [Anaerolineae bacterium]